MITVRSATLGDAERILEIYDYYVKYTAITFEYDTPSLSEFQKRMENTMQRYPYLVIEKDGRIQGYAYAGPFVGRETHLQLPLFRKRTGLLQDMPMRARLLAGRLMIGRARLRFILIKTPANAV